MKGRVKRCYVAEMVMKVYCPVLIFSSLGDPQNQYRSDLNWMKGVGWDTEGCMNITQAKKAGELLSDVSAMMCLCLQM